MWNKVLYGRASNSPNVPSSTRPVLLLHYSSPRQEGFAVSRLTRWISRDYPAVEFCNGRVRKVNNESCGVSSSCYAGTSSNQGPTEDRNSCTSKRRTCPIKGSYPFAAVHTDLPDTSCLHSAISRKMVLIRHARNERPSRGDYR
jgi:hypothetical protein